MTGAGTVADFETDLEGLTIKKQVHTDGDNVKVNLEVVSNYQQDATVTLLDPVPDGTEPAQIAFHPEKNPDHSRVRENGRFRLDLFLPAWQIREVVYGIKQVASAVDECAGTPEIDEIQDEDGEPLEDPDNEITWVTPSKTNSSTDDLGELTIENDSIEHTSGGSNDDTQEPSDELVDAVASEVISRLDVPDENSQRGAVPAEEVDTLRDRIDQLDSDIDGAETSIGTLTDDLQTTQELLDELSTVVDRVGDAEVVSELLAELVELADRLDDDETLVTVIDRLHSLTERVDSLEQWQTDLSSAHLAHTSTAEHPSTATETSHQNNTADAKDPGVEERTEDIELAFEPGERTASTDTE